MHPPEEERVPTGVIVGVVVLGLVAVSVVVANVAMRRQGYSIPGKTTVRCSQGHTFTTTWIEGGSLKAVRLGPRTRYQRCPVGHHWALVHPLKTGESAQEGQPTATG